MGFRFRKSIKIAPGVKINLNKKSVGLTVGGKGAKYTINSSGRRTATVGLPGTGLSYSAVSNNSSKKHNNSSKKRYSSPTPKTHISQAEHERVMADNLRMREERERQLAENREFNLFVENIFPSKVPSVYFGQYSSVRKFFTIACIATFVLAFSWPILWILFVIALYFRLFWKREDEKHVIIYKQARNFFKLHKYDKSLCQIELLLADEKSHDTLDRARLECILLMRGLTYNSLNDYVEYLYGAFSELNNYEDIKLTIDKYFELMASLNELDEYLVAKSAFGIIPNPLQQLRENIKPIHTYLNKNIFNSCAKILDNARNLKTEKGKLNRVLSYLDSLSIYEPILPAETLEYINTLKEPDALKQALILYSS
jgi:hypothetical protein